MIIKKLKMYPRRIVRLSFYTCSYQYFFNQFQKYNYKLLILIFLFDFITFRKAFPQTQTIPNIKTNAGVTNTGATIHVVNSNINATANTVRHKGANNTALQISNCYSSQKNHLCMHRFKKQYNNFRFDNLTRFDCWGYRKRVKIFEDYHRWISSKVILKVCGYQARKNCSFVPFFDFNL